MLCPFHCAFWLLGMMRKLIKCRLKVWRFVKKKTGMSRLNGYILVTANFWVDNSFLCEVSESLLNKPLIPELLFDVQYHLMYSKNQIFAHWYIFYNGLIMIVFNKHLFLICIWKDILWVSYLCFNCINKG